MIPLSFAQRRLWFLNRLEGATATYNIPLALRLTGVLNEPALRAAMADVVARHESLRTVFPEVDGEAMQEVRRAPDGNTFFSTRPVRDRDIDAAIDAVVRHRFDLESEIPVVTRLLRVAADEHVLIVVVHHIAADGWSLRPLARDLMHAYTARAVGTAPGWAPMPVQYADYTLWQRELLGDESDPDSLAAEQLAHWRTTLAGLPTELSLPTDRLRPAVATNRGDIVSFGLSSATHRKLIRLSRECSASVFMVLQAGLATLLWKLGAGTDIPLGTPIAGRTDEAVEELVGLFVNTLVLRTDTSGNPTFRELVERVRGDDLRAYAHQDLPFERLVEAINPERSLSRHPLFQVMLVLQNAEQPRFALPGIDVEILEIDTGTAKFDLEFQLFEQSTLSGEPTGLTGSLEYAHDLFDRESAATLAGRYRDLLDAALDGPDSPIGTLDLLTGAEQRRLLVYGTGTRRDENAFDVVGRICDVARQHPDRTALEDGGGAVTYAELVARARVVADRLRAHNVGRGSLVALLFDRGSGVVSTVLAMLGLGAAYLPLAPRWPVRRSADLLTDNGVPLLVCDPANARNAHEIAELAGVTLVGLPADHEPVGEIGRIEDPENDIAYVIFTSGSTGKPKGAMVTHRGLANHLSAKVADLDLTAADRVVLNSPLTFDVSVWQMLAALVAGATVLAADDATALDATALFSFANDGGATVLEVVPSLLRFALSAWETGAADVPPLAELRWLLVTGEALPPDLCARWFSLFPGISIVNAYGPTECSDDVTHAVITEAPEPGVTAVPIGRPIHNTRLYVLDECLRPTPIGVPGELYVGGTGVGYGYWRAPARTAQAFVANPFSDVFGDRMYRTGDRVRYLPDGQLEFQGRLDNQVKVRGQRVEPGEIEAVIGEHQSVERAVVVVRGTEVGDARLVAYLVPAPGRVIDTAALHAELSKRLPEYMVPSAFVRLDTLPLSANGKVDRNTLPEVELVVGAGRNPRSAREQTLCQLFAEVLGIDGVSIDAGFFELGGHSLLATRLVGRVRTVLGVDIGVRAVFEYPTVASLAEHLDSLDSPGAAFDGLLPLRVGGTRTPLFCVHPGVGLSWCYSGLLSHVQRDWPVYGLQNQSIAAGMPHPTSIQRMAAEYVELIRGVQPHGPFRLLGYSFGGAVAHAIATTLQAYGEEVALLAMVDAYPTEAATSGEGQTEHDFLVGLLRDADYREDKLAALPLDRNVLVKLVRDEYLGDVEIDETTTDAVLDACMNNARLHARFEPDQFTGDVLFFVASDKRDGTAYDWRRWQPHVRGTIVVEKVRAEHRRLMEPGVLAEIGPVLATWLEDGSISRSRVPRGVR